MKPNIVIFFVDDMGYGDASCLNPAGKVCTEHLDHFASQGMIFTEEDPPEPDGPGTDDPEGPPDSGGSRPRLKVVK